MFGFNFGPGGMPGMGMGGMPGSEAPSRRRELDTKFYDVLGLNKSSNENDIKKAFRKLAIQHHPDKGGDTEKFKELSRAYEVLSDPEKRRLYDEYGEEGLDGSGGGGAGMDMSDIFSMFGGGGFHGHGGGARRQQRRKGEDVQFPLMVDLEELYNGTSKKLKITKNIVCQGCKGKGGKTEGTCRDCKGSGVKIMIRQIGPGMIQQMQAQCNACSGTGSIIAEKDKCKQCVGQKVVKEVKTLEVFVAKGSSHGSKITFPKEADESPDTTPGDVIVIVQLKPHPTFRREGDHLFFKKTITLAEALCGFQFVIEHLDKRTLVVTSDGNMVIKPGAVKSILNEGMPQQRNPYNRGNMYVEFDVKFPSPSELSLAQRQQLVGLLPSSGEERIKSAGENSEQVELHDVDMSTERKRFAQERAEKEQEEEDDDHHEHGGHPASCRAQ